VKDQAVEGAAKPRQQSSRREPALSVSTAGSCLYGFWSGVWWSVCWRRC